MVGTRAETFPSDRIKTTPLGPRGRSTAPDAIDFASATQASGEVGRYEIIGTAGEGGMGCVYIGLDPQLHRKVAIKRIRADDAFGERLQRRRARLVREARAAAQLSHPNVIEIYDVGVVGSDVYVAMEYVEGETLRHHMRTLAGDWKKLLGLFHQAGQGLIAAHAAGLVHRDFKPENVLVGHDGRVRVVDFGLATPGPDHVSEDISDEVDDELVPLLTPSGPSPVHSIAIGGTPSYMPPEQLFGVGIGPQSDQFAFCVALYEALYGVRPFDEANPNARVARIAAGARTEPVRGQDLPANLLPVIVKGLSAEPHERYRDMRSLLVAVRRASRRRRRLWLYGLLAGLLASAGTVYALVPPAGRPCTGAQERFDAVWTRPRRENVEAAFLATDLRYADQTRARVLDGLDRYRTAWVGAYRDACAATHIDGTQSEAELDLRMRCLNERLAEFDALVEILGTANAAVVERAGVLVETFTPVDGCADLEALAHASPLPEGEDAPARAQRIQARLVALRAERSAGRHAQALEASGALLAQAEDFGYAPLLSAVHRLRGDLMLDLFKHREAIEAYRAAFFTAREGRDDDAALHAASDLLVALADETQPAEAATEWERHALATLGNIGEADPVVRARWLQAQAGLRRREQNHDQAIALLREVIELRTRLYGEDSMNVAESLGRLANVLNDVDQLDEALELHKRTNRIFLEEIGSEHPTVGSTYTNVGAVLTKLGRKAEAIEQHSRALSTYERTLGEDHVLVAIALNNLANNEADLGRHGDAIVRWRRAEKILRKAGYADHPHLAVVVDNIATSMRQTGQTEEALAAEAEALAIRERVLGADDPDVARSLYNRSLMFTDLDRYEDARRDLERAAAIYEKAFGPEHSLVATARGELGWVLVKLGEHDAGIQEIERSVAVRETVLGKEHEDLASAYHLLGSARLETGDPPRARAALERALAIAGSTEVGPERRLQIEFDLARALWESRADRQRARSLAEAALAGQRDLEARDEDEVAEIEAWLSSHIDGA